jgi:hypothetical protein
VYKIDVESIIKGLEDMYGVDIQENEFDYDFDIEEHEQITERDLRGDL